MIGFPKVFKGFHSKLLVFLWGSVPLLIFFCAYVQMHDLYICGLQLECGVVDFGRPLNVYDGIRHFLFICPALSLVAALPLSTLISPNTHLTPCIIVFALAAGALPEMISLHPCVNLS